MPLAREIRLKSGGRRPILDLLLALARAYQVPLAELRTHEGYEWMCVLSGRVRLRLADLDFVMTTRRGRRIRHPHPPLVRQRRTPTRRTARLSPSEDQTEWQMEWQTMPARAFPGVWALVCASVLAGQGLYLQQRNRTVVHGKEKVYGSIP
jgi:hypothetical protein